MGLVRNLVQQKNEKDIAQENYTSYKNMIFYGVTGKSSIIGGLSELLESPVLVLSPAGGSERIALEFPNIISYPVNNLTELNQIYDDVVKDFKIIRDLQQVIIDNNVERLDKAKKHFGEEWNEVYSMAKSNKLPISAIVLEEIATISNWIQEELEAELDMSYIGENKNNLGIDWAKFSRKITDFYSKFLRLPVTTILNTGEIQPKEKQKLTQVIPNLCQGSASRQLADLVGNVFYCYKSDDGKYFVRLNKNKDVFAKDKLLPVKSEIKLQDEIEVTNNPAKFWNYVSEISKDISIIETKNKKESVE